MQNNHLYIVLSQVKFIDFYWDKFQLDEFLKKTEVQVLDISNIITPHFSS